MSPTDRQVGYNALITRYGLCCVEDRTSSFIAKRRSVVDRTERADGSVVACYPGKYDFDDTLSAHLEFCLKYEGVKIAQVLAGLEPELRERAANYLYLAETRSSFAIEKEIPDS